ncbi:MAG: DNA alkylation repair protein [Bacteroidota bacterium]
MGDQFLIRDVFSAQVVEKMAHDIEAVYPQFDKKGFLESLLSGLGDQTYSERKEAITNALIRFLPTDYKKSVQLLLQVTPAPYEGDPTSDMVGRFYVSTFTAYISSQGMEYFEVSTQALYEMTKSFSSEWDIRPFLLEYPKKTLALLKKWAKDKNMHVRRLVSEGSRPNLPWGKKLKFVDQDPKGTTLPLLNLLQDDKAEYVRRSVANHLNDLAKNNADLVVQVLTEWKEKNLTSDKERMINHALRTLIKQGHQGALALIGFGSDFQVDISIQTLTERVKWGGLFEFDFTISNKLPKEQKLLVDYIIGFQKKDGSINNKVFKLKKIVLPANNSMSIQKSFSFKPISTRVYYPGAHHFQVQINGKIVIKREFMLLKS